MPPADQPRQREIRVFISSTFRDMQEEREELVKQIFPQLRRLCESRGVTWGEVDLRWGVPDEAKAEGKVLPLCLAEIERCRPYFIGLLGERYGWVPEEIPEELLEVQPWLSEHRKESVTALEILHGVLRNPEMSGHAFFYFRDPGCAASHAGFREEDPARRERLAALKDNIRKSGFPVAENFATPKQLGEWVLRDLTAVIEELYPEASIPDPLDRAAADHEAYAASRRRVYVGRPEYIERLDAHAAGDGPPLVITGESGGGKSALLANWTSQWGNQNPSTAVITHFIGGAPESADWVAMLRRLLGEFQRRFRIQIDTPDQPDGLRVAFANALQTVAARGRVVLVLDALNQIESAGGAEDLAWLPLRVPENIRLIVSTLAGPALAALRERGWVDMEVKPLKPDERERLIVAYLEPYAKRLSTARLQRIIAQPQSANGLYLSVMLHELRLFGRHEELDQRIAWYLEASGPLALYGKVIQRWERDYEDRGPWTEDLVGESLSRIWAARRGLSETELLESLGHGRTPLPRALWSPLFLAAGDALVNRGGLLTFSHQYLRDAVREAYLPTLAHQRTVHRQLAAYFFDQTDPQHDGSCNGTSAHAFSELPYHQLQGAAWDDVVTTLEHLPFLEAKATKGMSFDLVRDFEAAVRLLDEQQPPISVSSHGNIGQAALRLRIKLLQMALRRDIHFIARHSKEYPQALFQCFWNSCWWYDSPAAAPYVLPETRNPARGQEDARVHRLMEAWREQRKRLKGDFIWVRSLFPPRAPLGSAFVAKLTKHNHEVTSTAFDPASTRLASASRDRTIRISAVSDGSLLLESPFDKAGSIPQLTFSPNGQQLACLDDHGVSVLEARTGSPLVEFRAPEKTRAVAVWPGFRSVLVQSDDRLLICDIASGRILQETFIPSHLRQSQAVLCGASKYVAFKTSDSVEVWDAKVSRQVSSYSPHGPYKIAHITVSEDALLAGVSESGLRGGHDHYVIWETATGDVKQVIKGQQTETTSMAFSPDGRYFVTSGWDLNARVWDTASGECEQVLGGHESPVVATAVDPGSQLVACGCSLGELRVFRLGAEGQAKPRFIHNGHISQTNFLKDGTFVSWGSNELKTWDAMTGQCIKEERFKQRPAFLEYMGYGFHPRRHVVGCESGQAEGTEFRVDGTSVPIAWFSEFVGFPTTQPDCRTWIGYRWDQVFLLRLEGELGLRLEQSEEA